LRGELPREIYILAFAFVLEDVLAMKRRVSIQTALGDALQFRRLVGREALHRLFDFDVEVLGSSNALEPKALLGKAATVAIETGSGEVRYLCGIVTCFGLTKEDGRQSFYKMQLRPWLWLATRRSDFRIFQTRTVPEILTAVLDSYGHPVEKRLGRKYRSWDYCVQYHESDFNFISRLCEHEGIYYYFRHEADRHVLVLADETASSHAPLPGGGAVSFHPLEKSGMTRAGAGSNEDIYDWKPGEEIRSGFHCTNDCDPQKPGADLSGRSVARGRSNKRELAPGYTLRLVGHPRDDQNQTYLLLSVSYHLQENLGTSEEAGASEGSLQRFAFSAQPTTLAWRPPRTTPKPRTRGPQTAIVVGPANEDIWADPYGRIKVQFHWDRAGRKNENSSCWVRVSLAWAGAKFGIAALPRIGQEVIVDFLSGDPDHPIVIGRVFNAENMPAWSSLSSISAGKSLLASVRECVRIFAHKAISAPPPRKRS
jgi:type VI secretion system secreted protein VgrG